MKKLLTLVLFLSIAFVSNATTNIKWTENFKSEPSIQAISPELGNITMDEFLKLTPKKYKEITGKSLGLKKTLQLKAAQKLVKKHMAGSTDMPKGVYILLAIIGWGFLGIGMNTDWSGNDWWVCLLLSFLCWIPGVIYALIKMKNYYK